MRRRDLLVSLSLIGGRALAGPGRSRPPADAGVAQSTPKPLAFPHQRPIVAFTTSPDGLLLATGAECSPSHADDALEGVACWDLQTLTVRWVTRLEGGVGLNDRLGGALAFSPDGRLLGANFHTNALALLDVSTGQLLKELRLTRDDGPPAWCWSNAPAHPDSVVVEAAGQLHLASVNGARAILPEPLGWPLAFDPTGLVVLSNRVLSRGSTRYPLVTTNGARQISAAISRTAIVVGTEAGEVLVVDRASFAVRHRVSIKAGALSVSRRGDVVVVILPSHSDAVIVRNGRPEPVPGPLARRDWLGFNDGRAVAVSPDGARIATVSPAGAVFEVTGGRVSQLGTVDGADTVSWPVDHRVVALGPRVVGVIEPGRGVVLTSRL